MSTENLHCCTTSTCEAMLCTLMNAYTALIAGQGVQEVEMDGDRTRYQPAQAKELKARIHSLHQTCGNEASAALLGLGRGRRSMQVCFNESYRCHTIDGCH